MYYCKELLDIDVNSKHWKFSRVLRNFNDTMSERQFWSDITRNSPAELRLRNVLARIMNSIQIFIDMM